MEEGRRSGIMVREANAVKPKVRCREYQEGDYPATAALWEATGLGGAPRGDSAEVIEATLARGGRFLVLEAPSEGGVLGTAWLTSDGRRLYLHHFGILPRLQGQGLGRILLGEALRVVRALGLQVKLEVHRTNARARDLYLRAGFAPLGDYEVLIMRDVRG